ncbi:MAG: metallophosphoesterase [Lactobacillales bacterium]|jgi:DNA repair exonuclease SbcCD nuclease subunit|nr:metallophosphoesterase [Lactobacillales bacterium]
MVRFIHTADLHMDRAFEGIQPKNQEFGNLLEKAKRKLIENIATVAIEEQVDFVILAGDTFHQPHSSMSFQRVLNAQFERLQEQKIAVFMNFGNHDYYEPNRYWYDVPENVHLFINEAVETVPFVTKNQEKVAISSFSYNHRWLNEEKVLEFPAKNMLETDFQVGIYHGEAGNITQSGQSYAPFSVTQMQAKNYDYWALGHIHVPTDMSGDKRVQYSGTPQGHTRKETQIGGVLLVELTKTSFETNFIPVAEVSWVREEISLKDIENLSSALAKLRQVVKRKIEETDKLVLLQLDLFDVAQFGSDFVQKVEEGELADELEQLFPTRLQISKIKLKGTTSEEEKIVLPVNRQTVEENLRKLADDFEGNPQFLPLFEKMELNIDEEWKASVLEQVKESFFDKFEVEEG